MRRWGILSDVHGNLLALERAVAEFRKREVDRIAVLGDSLGRGDSDGCIALIRALADVSVVGNRDLDWKDRVSPASRAYVLGLPRVLQTDELAFTHGDRRLTRDLSTDEARTGFRRAVVWMLRDAARVWFFGHSHHARVWELDANGAPPRLVFDVARDQLPARICLAGYGDDGRRWAVNVGSVGLPFAGKGPSSATVFDGASGQLDLFPV